MYNYYMTKEDENNMEYWQNTKINRINENILNIVELIPIDGRKSFNSRAKVIETGNSIYLLSYTTIVCRWDKNENKFVKLWDDYSATTMRHINSFMRYLGFMRGGKAWWNSLKYGYNYTISELVNI